MKPGVSVCLAVILSLFCAGCVPGCPKGIVPEFEDQDVIDLALPRIANRASRYGYATVDSLMSDPSVFTTVENIERVRGVELYTGPYLVSTHFAYAPEGGEEVLIVVYAGVNRCGRITATHVDEFGKHYPSVWEHYIENTSAGGGDQ